MREIKQEHLINQEHQNQIIGICNEWNGLWGREVMENVSVSLRVELDLCSKTNIAL